MDCGYSLEPLRRGGSNEYPQSMFWAEIWKVFFFLSENFQFLKVKFSMYLKRRVFVMKSINVLLLSVQRRYYCFSSSLSLYFIFVILCPTECCFVSSLHVRHYLVPWKLCTYHECFFFFQDSSVLTRVIALKHCPFQGGYYNVDNFRWDSSIVTTRGWPFCFCPMTRHK